MPDVDLNGGTLTSGSVVAGSITGPVVVVGDVLPNSTAAPANPTAGNSTFYAQQGPGLGIPAWIGERGNARKLATALWGKTWSSITASGGATTNNAGAGTFAATGTVSTSTFSANGFLQNVASAASAAAQALMRTGGVYRRGGSTDVFAGVFQSSRFYLPDASYDNTGASTGTRVQAGLSASPTTSLGSDHGGTATSAAMFARAHVNGGSTDTNWQFVTCSGSASTVADTGLVFTAQHVYEVEVFIPAGATTVDWRIRDVTAGTEASGQATLTAPASTASLSAFVGVATVDATARNFSFRNIYAESDKG